MARPEIVFDTEIYKDYFLVMFKHALTGKVRYFEQFEGQPLDADGVRKVLSSSLIIGFNSINFDIPILTYALKGATCAELKACCDYIINEKRRSWQCETYFGFRISQKLDHIDLIEVAAGKASLKAYGGKMHSRTIQDLPIAPDESIAPEQRGLLMQYCANDLQTTLDLYNQLRPQLALRAEMSKSYGVDLRSKSDAQMAEAVIRHEIETLTNKKIDKPSGIPEPFKYTPPVFIQFSTSAMQEVLRVVENAVFVVTDGGKVLMPRDIAETPVRIGESSYKIGIGGLHSMEECVRYRADEGHVLLDKDVNSYYPSIILNSKLYPELLGRPFLRVYRDLVARRLAAKAAGDKAAADCLKIVINSSFGHLGNKWSILYSPKLLIQVTMTGQLSLLMLIEMLEQERISVVSANTDGVVIYCRGEDVEKANKIIASWELITGFETEEARYGAIYLANVNNYVALKDKGCKLKGVYAPPVPVANSWPNPHNQVCVDAVLAFLQHGHDIGRTIAQCKDIRKFVTVRQVTGGAVKDNTYLGKTCRWYYSHLAFGTINYKVNNHIVPRSEGAMPLMTLPDELPGDIDYGWYEAEAYKILSEIGYEAA